MFCNKYFGLGGGGDDGGRLHHLRRHVAHNLILIYFWCDRGCYQSGAVGIAQKSLWWRPWAIHLEFYENRVFLLQVSLMDFTESPWFAPLFRAGLSLIVLKTKLCWRVEPWLALHPSIKSGAAATAAGSGEWAFQLIFKTISSRADKACVPARTHSTTTKWTRVF